MAHDKSTKPARAKGVHKANDQTLAWVLEEYPQLAEWRELAMAWLQGETRGIAHRLLALGAFFERYLIAHSLPLDPVVFLARTTNLPDFFQVACPNSKIGLTYHNHIRTFLDFVLLERCSEPNDFGEPVVLSTFHNPLPLLSLNGLPTRDEAKPSPLPYGYIEELREMLAPGPNFRDWTWAYTALGTQPGTRGGRVAYDWFEVSENQIDRTDPDCVYRVRETRRPSYRGGQILEMWSPVRWVALLIKLILPLRTFQVRMLDSGEADTWHYEQGRWIPNPHRLARGSVARPLQQGVFRPADALNDGEDRMTILHINTNKTADIGTSGPEKGYDMPWYDGGELHQNAFYWLEKLRNWQKKYNPIARRTSWTELDGRHMKVKSDLQLAGYSDTCFLFREPALDWAERHLPLTDNAIKIPWYKLLAFLEQRLAQRKETHCDGTPIRFLPPPECKTASSTTLFPLHSLRVSLITALASEGKVPFPILQKLVGHSRLLMTLYYFKPGATSIKTELLGAKERLEAKKHASIQQFLRDTEHEELLQRAICNDKASLATAIPVHPAARIPVGWSLLHHGRCLMGDNARELESNQAVGGCFNGGPTIGSASRRHSAPVPGGAGNCIRCRWFVTEPHFLPALVAHFNNLAYYFDEARFTCIKHEKTRQQLKRQRFDAEVSGQPFTLAAELGHAQKLWEDAMRTFSNRVDDLVACWWLIERCKAALDAEHGDGTQLVAVGDAADVSFAFEEVESELLQLAGVCEDAELYPGLEPGEAIFRRSQLLDMIFERESLPPLFMRLGKEEQLLAGNAFMRHLAQQMNPQNPALGRRKVIELMDAGTSLSEYFGINLATWLKKPDGPLSIVTKRRPGIEGPGV